MMSGDGTMSGKQITSQGKANEAIDQDIMMAN